MWRMGRSGALLALVCAIVLAWTATSEAVLVNRYTFNNGGADDEIGTLDGQLKGTATISGLGRLELTGGLARNSYLNLPDGIATGAAQSGTAGAFSYEIWARANANTNWAALVSFGGATGENETFDGGAKDYLQLIPQNGNNQRLRITTHRANVAGEQSVDAAQALATGSDQHIAVVVNQSAGMPGTVGLYVNGAFVGQTAIAAGLNVSTMIDNDNFLGRSQFNDNSFNGSIDEFRVYNHALSAAEVSASFATGPVVMTNLPPLPTLLVSRRTGTLTIRGGQTAKQVVGYSITSSGGSLDSAFWDSVAGHFDDSATGNGSFDTNNAWTVLSPLTSHTNLAEFELEGGDGGLLSTRRFLRVGAPGAWIRSPVEDLAMSMTLDDGTTLNVPVIYLDSHIVRSDLNFDGLVTAADWPTFRDNFRVNLAGLNTAQAFGRGDLDGDGDNDYADFLIFQTDYDTANGAGAFVRLIDNAVPEPSSLVGLALAVGGVALVRRRRALRWLPMLVVSALCVAWSAQANADLLHQYTFNFNIDDSVGTAHGTLIDPGTPTAVYTPGGQLDLSANTGQTSNFITNDSFVDLPNGIISSLGSAATFEMWLTVSQNRDWAEVFSFGAPSSGSEGASTGGGGKGYVTLIPDTGNAANTMSVHYQVPNGVQMELNAPNNQMLTTGQEHHIVSVMNKSDLTAGPGGTARLYLNGQIVATNALPEAFSLGALTDVNNWLGRSQWGDPLFDGLYNEFRIYNHALTAGEVTINHQAGPALPIGLTLRVNTADGAASIRNDATMDIAFNYYEITSSAGALSPSGWNSLSDQNVDPTGTGDGQTWDEGGVPSDTLLTELFLRGTTLLTPGQELQLGTAFDITHFGAGNNGDLQFQFARRLEQPIRTQVEYYYDPAFAGDYNSDGSVDAADYTVWRDTLLSTTELQADGDSSGTVDQADYDLWRSNFGNVDTPASISAAAVPEPTTLLLVGGCVVLGAGRVRTRRAG